MKFNLKRYVALIACLGLFCLPSANAQHQREYQVATGVDNGEVYTEDTYRAEKDDTSAASYNSFDTFGGDSGVCGDSSCACYTGGTCGRVGNSGGEGLLSFLERPGQFYVGVDYLQVRASFSEATAFVTQTQNAAAAPPSITNVFTPIEYDYDPSYRVYGGYRLCDCGGEIQFGYTRFDSDGSAQVIAGPGDVIVAVPEEVVSNGPGTGISVNSSVTAQSFDLAFSKTIPLGGCCDTCCDCGDACTGDSCTGDACGCGDSCCPPCCPAWDITWSAGVRFSEVNWDRNSAEFAAVGGPGGNTASTVLDFEGGGPRWGLEGRRYLGSKYRFALFLKGDISLLLGNVGITNTRTTVVGATPTLVNTTTFETTQIVPVLDIVAGGTANITDRLTLSGGYLFSAWHDLGQRDTFDILDDPGFANSTDLTFDDANILGFDGYFIRAEYAF